MVEPNEERVAGLVAKHNAVVFNADGSSGWTPRLERAHGRVALVLAVRLPRSAASSREDPRGAAVSDVKRAPNLALATDVLQRLRCARMPRDGVEEPAGCYHRAMDDASLRRHLIDLLRGRNAHLDFDSAVKKLPAELRGRTPGELGRKVFPTSRRCSRRSPAWQLCRPGSSGRLRVGLGLGVTMRKSGSSAKAALH